MARAFQELQDRLRSTPDCHVSGLHRFDVDLTSASGNDRSMLPRGSSQMKDIEIEIWYSRTFRMLRFGVSGHRLLCLGKDTVWPARGCIRGKGLPA